MAGLDCEHGDFVEECDSFPFLDGPPQEEAQEPEECLGAPLEQAGGSSSSTAPPPAKRRRCNSKQPDYALPIEAQLATLKGFFEGVPERDGGSKGEGADRNNGVASDKGDEAAEVAAATYEVVREALRAGLVRAVMQSPRNPVFAPLLKGLRAQTVREARQVTCGLMSRLSNLQKQLLLTEAVDKVPGLRPHLDRVSEASIVARLPL